MKELLLQNSRLDGRYDILKVLGRGSYAEIFVARDNFAAPDATHKSVVVKALNVFLQEEPDVDLERTLIENFQNEAVALDRVRHPNVINRLGHGTARDLNGLIFHYLVVEYLAGGDLGQTLRREPPTLQKTLFYLEQVCAGLAHAHSKGVIHRDIKPQNLFLSADKKTVKIADFGVAKFDNFDSPVTRVGTNTYAAPEHSPLTVAAEIADGADDARLTPAADVYSLAKTVYALLAGESPRKFANAPLTAFPPRVAGEAWANDILRVLEAATQTQVSRRTKTIEEFWRALCRAAGETEEATCVAAPNLAVAVKESSLVGFSPKAPRRPAFDSMGNVQISLPGAEAELPERPRLVVEFAEKPKPPPLDAPPRQPDKLTTLERNENNQPVAPRESEFTPAVKPPSRFQTGVNKFFKRLLLRAAVVLILLGVFAGVVGATYNYFQSQGYFDWSQMFAPTATVAADGANLRSTAEINAGNVIGFLKKNSELRILEENEQWFYAEVRKIAPDSRDVKVGERGWINKATVKVK